MRWSVSLYVLYRTKEKERGKAIYRATQGVFGSQRRMKLRLPDFFHRFSSLQLRFFPSLQHHSVSRLENENHLLSESQNGNTVLNK